MRGARFQRAWHVGNVLHGASTTEETVGSAPPTENGPDRQFSYGVPGVPPVFPAASARTRCHPRRATRGAFHNLALLAVAAFVILGVTHRPTQSAENSPDEAAARLATEVRDQGWIVYSARSEKGDWDLFLCRPDGSAQHNITRTPQYNEAAPQFSHDAKKLLYRRLKRDEKIDNNHYGTQGELVISQSDGSAAAALGASGEYPWASWSPDGRQIACLAVKGISIIDVAGCKVVRTMPRKGFFQQLTWSSDGRWFCGVSNAFGASWSIGRMAVATGEINSVSNVDCCTPDWFPDNRSIIFSNRPRGQKTNKGYGWTQLWMADAEGRERRLVYGEDGRHVYCGCISPDGKYVLFAGNMNENGDPGGTGSPMRLIRLADTPMIAGESLELRKLHPNTQSGPMLTLPKGWEPCWTGGEIEGAH